MADENYTPSVESPATRALILADVHTRQRTWTNNPLVSGDAYAALKLVRETLATRCGLCISAGDLFDSNRPTSTDLLAVENCLMGFGRVLYVNGNHDSVDPAFVDVLDGKLELARLGVSPVTVLDCPVFGADYTACASENGIESVLSAAVRHCSSGGRHATVVLHCAFRHLMGIDGAWHTSLEDVAGILRKCGLSRDARMTIVCGHVHKRDVRPVPGFDGVTFLSPGSLYPTNSLYMRGDTPSVTLLDLATGDMEEAPVPVRLYGRVPVSGDVDAEMARLAEGRLELPSYLQVVVPDGMADAPVPASTKDVIVQAVPETLQDEDIASALPDTTGYTLADAVADELDDDDMKDIARSIVDSDDPLGTLNGLLAAWEAETTE